MNTYLIVKTLHIISATLMVGTGFGTAFYLFGQTAAVQLPRSRSSRIGYQSRLVVYDPAVIFQPLSAMDAV